MNQLDITNPITSKTQSISLSSKKIENVGKLSNTKTINPFLATLIPVRTNSWKNFSKDFFLPTVVNHAMKVDNIAAKIFAVLGAIILDVLTLPIRLVTAPFRAALSNKKESHDLYKFLKSSGVDEKVLDADELQLKLKWTAESQNCFTYNNDGTISAPVMEYNKAFNTSFVDVPSSFNSNLRVEDPKKIDENKVSAPEINTNVKQQLPTDFPTFQIDMSSKIFYNIREMKVIIKAVVDGETIVKEKIVKTEDGKTLDRTAMDAALENCKIEVSNELKSSKIKESNVEFLFSALTIREEDGQRKFAYVSSSYHYDTTFGGYKSGRSSTTSTSVKKEAFTWYPFGPKNPTNHLDENSSFLASYPFRSSKYIC
ncbi:MAG: hypothetical protein H7A37_00580 [Chlamydiales bacterium]|nr:hypothetical protein [Chlamydiales bacterium]